MVSATEVKLLTLLNVTAIKRPRELDIPGGHRASPSVGPPESSSRGQNPVGSTSKKQVKVVNGSNGHSATSPPAKRCKSVNFAGEVGPSGSTYSESPRPTNGLAGKGKGKAKQNGTVNGHAGSSANALTTNLDLVEDSEENAVDDAFSLYFGPTPSDLTPESMSIADETGWETEKSSLDGFGKASCSTLPSSSSTLNPPEIVPSLLLSLSEKGASALTGKAIKHLGSYRDFYLHSLDGEADGSEKVLYGDQKEAMRKAAMVHSVNHVLKNRRRIIRNNEKLAHSESGDVEPPRDQSFTRPKVLLVLPLRSLALHYLTAHLFPLAPGGTQIENLRPFMTSFSLPADAQDALTTPSAAASYPIDHLVNFRGNSDDNFRFGIKLTRKAWRVVMMPANEEKLMDCDIIVASPIGLKMTAEKEQSTDLLSSIEICIMDGLDVMQMQNWDHVQFIFENLNKIPDDPHGCDFSRVKPWYLEGQAKYLRQTILLSRYDSPEARGVFQRRCLNLHGKLRLESSGFPGILDRMKFGLEQRFERFDLEGPQGVEAEIASKEVDQRFEWFKNKTLPALMKSAKMRQNTLVVVPSYFDFVRVTNYLRKAENVSFAAISEYSSNPEISRARTEFFRGKKALLIVTERFHFYRRYKIRGAQTFVFYALPDHAQFYAEFLETPFLPSRTSRKKSNNDGEDDEEEEDVDPNDIACRVLFSRFDFLKLERIVGTVNARLMVTKGEAKFRFT